MAWIEDAEMELVRARAAEEAGNPGRVRTAARRAAGYALRELEMQSPGRNYGSDFLRQLRGLAEDRGAPEEVRGAAQRLQARLSADFVSESGNPVRDAQVIIRFVQQALQHPL
jgi:HEPN domain-containing protein